MKYKYYYFDSENICVLSKEGQDSSSAEVLKRDNTNLIINMHNKSVENLSGFFKSAVMKAIIIEDYSIQLNDNDIQPYSFYADASFSELRELLNNSATICNESLSKIKKELNQ